MERTGLNQKRREHTTEPEPIYPESFLNLLIGPDLGAVGEGSAKRVQRGAVATPGFDVGRSDMGDPRVFSREFLIRDNPGDLNV